MTTTRLAFTLLVAVLWAKDLPADESVGKLQDLPRRPIPLNHLSIEQREKILGVIRHPTLAAQGPLEAFVCRPEHYYFFLDNPDRAVTAWRRLGAVCVDIAKLGEDAYAWEDGAGSKVVWQTVCRGDDYRVWFAEGKVRAAKLLPPVPLSVVVVMRHHETPSSKGYAIMQQQSEMFMRTNSRMVAIAARMLGQSTTRAAEDGLKQMQLFFSALSRFISEHPKAVGPLTQSAVRAQRE